MSHGSALLALGFTLFAWAAVPAAADVESGKALYVAQCRKCHGDQGQGNPAIYRMMKATLVHLGSKEAQAKSDESIRKSIIDGVGKMKPVTGLTTQQAADAVTFLRTLRLDQAGAAAPSAPPTPSSATPAGPRPSPGAASSRGNVESGKALYATECRRCHGDQGQGNPAIYRMVKATLVHLGSKEAQAKSDESIRKNIIDGVGKMKPAKALTTQQMDDLMAFLRTLKQP